MIQTLFFSHSPEPLQRVSFLYCSALLYYFLSTYLSFFPPAPALFFPSFSSSCCCCSVFPASPPPNPSSPPPSVRPDRQTDPSSPALSSRYPPKINPSFSRNKTQSFFSSFLPFFVLSPRSLLPSFSWRGFRTVFSSYRVIRFPTVYFQRLVTSNQSSEATRDTTRTMSSMDVDTEPPVSPPAGVETAPKPTNGINGTHTLPPDPPKVELDGEAYKQAGNKFFKQKEYIKAIEQYTKAIECEPENATFLSNRAAAYMSAGKFKLALDDCVLADRHQSDNGKTLLRMARIQVALGRPADALQTYDRMSPPASTKDRAPAQQMLQHLKSAEEPGTGGSMTLFALDRAESGLGMGVEPPKKWKILRGEANLRMGTQNSLGEAQNVAMSLLRQNAQDPEALVLRGRILYAQGENPKAAAHFQEALRCDPDMKQARIYLKRARELEKKKEAGNEAFKKGDLKVAKELYSEALAVDPDNKGTNSKLYQNRAATHSKVLLLLARRRCYISNPVFSSSKCGMKLLPTVMRP